MYKNSRVFVFMSRQIIVSCKRIHILELSKSINHNHYVETSNHINHYFFNFVFYSHHFWLFGETGTLGLFVFLSFFFAGIGGCTRRGCFGFDHPEEEITISRMMDSLQGMLPLLHRITTIQRIQIDFHFSIKFCTSKS